jgi:hypothetical protein
MQRLPRIKLAPRWVRSQEKHSLKIQGTPKTHAIVRFRLALRGVHASAEARRPVGTGCVYLGISCEVRSHARP